jgi:hypothetical protein
MIGATVLYHVAHYGLLFGLPLLIIGLVWWFDERKKKPRAPRAPRAPVAQRTPRGPRPWVLAALSAGAGVIHVGVFPEHARESWYFGAFFAAAAGAQLLWAFLVLRRPGRALYVIGAAGNAIIAALWAVSRTTGVPAGPGSGKAEPVNLLGVLATVYEVLLALVCVLLARGSEGTKDWARGRATAVVVLAVAAGALLVPRAT